MLRTILPDGRLRSCLFSSCAARVRVLLPHLACCATSSNYRTLTCGGVCTYIRYRVDDQCEIFFGCHHQFVCFGRFSSNRYSVDAGDIMAERAVQIRESGRLRTRKDLPSRSELICRDQWSPKAESTLNWAGSPDIERLILIRKMSEKSKEKLRVGKIRHLDISVLDGLKLLCHHAKARKVHQAATAPAIPLALITQFTPSFISILCAAQNIKLLIIAAMI